MTESDFTLIGERTLDVSSEGMLVVCEGPVDLGACILFSLRLPGGQRWVDGEGRVSRTVRGLRATDTRRAVGIAFTEMEHVDRVLLRVALEGHPPPVPARHARTDYVSAVRSIDETDFDLIAMSDVDVRGTVGIARSGRLAIAPSALHGPLALVLQQPASAATGLLVGTVDPPRAVPALS